MKTDNELSFHDAMLLSNLVVNDIEAIEGWRKSYDDLIQRELVIALDDSVHITDIGRAALEAYFKAEREMRNEPRPSLREFAMQTVMVLGVVGMIVFLLS